METTRETLPVGDGEGGREVLNRIRDMGDRIVVNIAGPGDAGPVFFTQENLEARLKGEQRSLLVETVREREYRDLIVSESANLIRAARDFSAALPERFLPDLSEEAAHLEGRLRNFLLFLHCFSLQRPGKSLERCRRTLVRTAEGLKRDALQCPDTVKTLDLLRYRLMPALAAILDILGMKAT